MKHFLILLYTIAVIAGGIWLIAAMTIDTFAFSSSQPHLYQHDETIAVPIKCVAAEETTKSTSIYYANMLTPSDITEEELAQALKYDLVDLAGTFLEAEEEHGVNAVYLAAISALESGWGRYQFEKNNIFGFGSKEFDSEEECIMYVAEFLAEHYLSKDGVYYGGGYRLKHVNKRWNGSDHWLTEVKSIANDIIGRIEDYRREVQA